MILITGSGTVLGKKLSNYLFKKKFNILALYNQTFPKNLSKEINKVKINLEKKIDISNQVNTIIHCASKVPGDKVNKKQIYNKNIKITKNLLRLSKQKKIENFIFISSMAVYGKPKVKIITDRSKKKPEDTYGMSKLHGEKKIILFCKKNKINFIILRVPALLGRNTRNNFLSKRVLDIKRNKQFLTSNVNFKFNNFIHVNNLIEIIYFILKKNIKNSIFNLCLNDHISLKKVYTMIEKEIKRKINYIVINNKSYYSISSKKIKKYKLPLYTAKKTFLKFIIENFR